MALLINHFIIELCLSLVFNRINDAFSTVENDVVHISEEEIDYGITIPAVMYEANKAYFDRTYDIVETFSQDGEFYLHAYIK